MIDPRDNGDDFARGFVTECPECGGITYRDGLCENEDCLYDGEVVYDPFDMTDVYKDELAWLDEEDD